MAIAKMPLLSEHVCGKIGQNLVFRVVKGRAIISTCPSFGRRILSARQQRVNGILAELSRLHTTLSLKQVEDWTIMKSYKTSRLFGLPRSKSVINSFVQVNFFRLDRDLPPLMDPPTTPMKGNISELNVINKPNESRAVVLSWILPPGALEQDAVDVWVTIPFNTITRKAQSPEFRHRTYVSGNSTSVDITGLESGKYYHIQARFVQEDGRVGVFHQLPGIRIE